LGNRWRCLKFADGKLEGNLLGFPHGLPLGNTLGLSNGQTLGEELGLSEEDTLQSYKGELEGELGLMLKLGGMNEEESILELEPSQFSSWTRKLCI